MHKTWYRGAVMLLVSLALCTVSNPHFSVYAARVQRDLVLTMIVRSSPDAAYETQQTLRLTGLKRILANAVQEKPEFSPFLTDVYVIVRQETTERKFRLEQSGHLWDDTEGKRYTLPGPYAKILLTRAQRLTSRHYGELMAWEEADRVVKFKSIFTIRDLETGLHFRVQRRAGRDHADVQPLTREDTKIMKQIYREGWSWKRKAIIVESGDKRLAASMNGMPHGGDGIPGNGFSGHFCVHFLNSTTHRADEPDPGHQFMVYKAAGHLRSFLDAASPVQLAGMFVEAMHDQDTETLRDLFEGMDKEKTALLIRELESLEPVRTIKLREFKPNKHPLTAALELQLELRRKRGLRKKTEFEFIFVRQTPYTPWRFQDVSVAKS